VSRLFGTLALSAVVSAGAAAAERVPAADPTPTEQVRVYDPVSKNSDILLGKMQLSESLLSFDLLKGHMDLVLDGTESCDDEFEVRCALFYKVANATEYFRLNKKANGYCHQPVTAVTVRVINGGEVRVAFLVDDDAKYRLADYAICSADTYALHAVPHE
jgi:hypothetical protein